MDSGIATVATAGAPRPAGHYSQAVIHNGTVYAAGQLAVDVHTGVPCSGSAAEQTEVILRNLGCILEAAGSDLSHVLRTTAYVTDVTLWSEVNTVYAKVFADHLPARTIVPVNALRHGLCVEIDAIAAVKDPSR